MEIVKKGGGSTLKKISLGVLLGACILHIVQKGCSSDTSIANKESITTVTLPAKGIHIGDLSKEVIISLTDKGFMNIESNQHERAKNANKNIGIDSTLLGNALEKASKGIDMLISKANKVDDKEFKIDANIVIVNGFDDFSDVTATLKTTDTHYIFTLDGLDLYHPDTLKTIVKDFDTHRGSSNSLQETMNEAQEYLGIKNNQKFNQKTEELKTQIFQEAVEYARNNSIDELGLENVLSTIYNQLFLKEDYIPRNMGGEAMKNCVLVIIDPLGNKYQVTKDVHSEFVINKEHKVDGSIID